MWSLIGTALSWLLSLITGRKEAAGVAQGRAEQKADSLEKANERAQEARDVQDRIDAAGSDELERLRNKWTKPD